MNTDNTTHSHIDLESYKSYLQLISSFPKISSKEQMELLNQIHSDNIDEKTKNRLSKQIFKSNLRLVTNIANKYKTKGLPFMDIIHEGNAGLMKAIGKFDPSRGFQLSTCAYVWITQHIERFISDKLNLIRLSVHLSDLKSKILKKINYCKLNHQSVSIEDLCREFKISKKKIRQLFYYKDMSIMQDNVEMNENANSFSNFIDDDIVDIFQIETAKDSLNVFNYIKSQLNETEQYIVQSRYLDEPNLSFQIIADNLNLTINEVRKLNNKILQKIKKEYKKNF